MRKAVRYGILAGFFLAHLVITGCALTGSKQSQSGPSRGDNPISGDLTNADITINDSKVVYCILGSGLLSICGFVLLTTKLAKHHATVNRAIAVKGPASN